MVYALFGEDIRAHSSRVVEYVNGSFIKTTSLPEWLIMDIQLALNQAATMLKLAMESDVERDWGAMFHFLSNLYPADIRRCISPSDFGQRTERNIAVF